MDLKKKCEKVESQQDESESTLSKQVSEMIGKYQMEGMEYLIKPGRFGTESDKRLFSWLDEVCE